MRERGTGLVFVCECVCLCEAFSFETDNRFVRRTVIVSTEAFQYFWSKKTLRIVAVKSFTTWNKRLKF